MNLWDKGDSNYITEIEKFTVGRDREFDQALAPFDVEGSLAHTAMLARVGLLPADEYALIKKELEQILSEIEQGNFVIDENVEDVHSQIELMLTERIGDAGKKIHSGRSRNDQVAVDIKLFLRKQLCILKDAIAALFDQLMALSEAHKDKLLPGYTHMQVAMPSSFGLWFGAYAESLVDDMSLMLTAYKMVNKNPLGSGAGYGTSLPLDRQYTTALLQFGGLHYNSMYAQMTRGKTERFVAVALSSIAATLARLCTDACLYMCQNFGFISLPERFTTGSSIMPHKKNPDVFELIRGKCNRLQAVPNELALLAGNLPSGYHRDMQLTKEILFPAIEDLKECLSMTYLMMKNIVVRDGILADPKYKYIFTVERVNELVTGGTPFRDAYRDVAREVEQGQFSHMGIGVHTHEGSIGNLGSQQIKQMMQEVLSQMP